MTLRAKGARKRRGSSPRRKEEGTVKVCPEAGRERRLMYGHLGAPARAAVNRERRAPAAGSRAFIKDAGRRFAAIPHIRPGHRSEEHTSELQSQSNLVCRLLLEKKK